MNYLLVLVIMSSLMINLAYSPTVSFTPVYLDYIASPTIAMTPYPSSTPSTSSATPLPMSSEQSPGLHYYMISIAPQFETLVLLVSGVSICLIGLALFKSHLWKLVKCVLLWTSFAVSIIAFLYCLIMQYGPTSAFNLLESFQSPSNYVQGAIPTLPSSNFVLWALILTYLFGKSVVDRLPGRVVIEAFLNGFRSYRVNDVAPIRYADLIRQMSDTTGGQPKTKTIG